MGTLAPVTNLADAEKMNLTYFSAYCKEVPKVTQEFKLLFKNCLKSLTVLVDKSKINEKAEVLYKSHYKKYLTGGQLAEFIKEIKRSREYQYYVDFDLIKEVFSSWNAFDEYLKESKSIKVEINEYNEFIDFYNKYKTNNKAAIEFSFKYLM